MPVSFPPIIQQHFPAASLDVLSFLNFRYPSFAPSETRKWQVKILFPTLPQPSRTKPNFGVTTTMDLQTKRMTSSYQLSLYLQWFRWFFSEFYCLFLNALSHLANPNVTSDEFRRRQEVLWLVTAEQFEMVQYCNDHVGEQEMKSKHDKDKRFHDDRLKNLVVIWKIFERKRPAEFRLSTRMHFIVVTRWVSDSAW